MIHVDNLCNKPSSILTSAPCMIAKIPVKNSPLSQSCLWQAGLSQGMKKLIRTCPACVMTWFREVDVWPVQKRWQKLKQGTAKVADDAASEPMLESIHALSSHGDSSIKSDASLSPRSAGRS